MARGPPSTAGSSSLPRNKTKDLTLNGTQRPVPRKRTWVDFDGDEHMSFRPGGTTMNGHSTPNGKKFYKRPRLSHSPSTNGAATTMGTALQEQREQLPIFSGKDALISEVRKHDVTVLLGETGSGKTTQVPQYLLEAGLASRGMIACTQPRRVAAISLAARVAAEQSVPLGTTVGYQVRFDESACEGTKIKYMTDGMLVRELLSDPLLSRYSVILVDEAHERTLRTDLLLANLKAILKKRNSDQDMTNGKGKAKATSNHLKVVIMSATLDAEKFSTFFNGAKILYVKGRQYPVKLYHTATIVPDIVEAASRTFFQIHLDQPPGDVLIFMPGQEDIESLESTIKLWAQRLPPNAQDIRTLPLYAALPPAQQFIVFAPAPPGTRKCIIATNIAETSITVPGVKYVIDSGKFKEKNHIVGANGHAGFDALMTRDITKSSAMQRAGRAGREGPGFCFRLFTEEAFSTLPASAEPEICRTSLASSMLELKCLGFDMDEVDFMDRPDWESVSGALRTLVLIGAFDDRKQLTLSGRQMSKFPLEPIHACAVLKSRTYGPVVTSAVVSIASILSSTSKVFQEPSDPALREQAMEARRKFIHPSGDHLTALNALTAYDEIARTEKKGGRRRWCKDNFLNERTCAEALNIRDQIRSLCAKLGIQLSADNADAASSSAEVLEEGVLRSLTAGYAQNIALLQPDGTYKQFAGNSAVKVHPASALADKRVPAIIYDELTHTNQIYARGVSSVPRRYVADVMTRPAPA